MYEKIACKHFENHYIEMKKNHMQRKSYLDILKIVFRKIICRENRMQRNRMQRKSYIKKLKKSYVEKIVFRHLENRIQR